MNASISVKTNQEPTIVHVTVRILNQIHLIGEIALVSVIIISWCHADHYGRLWKHVRRRSVVSIGLCSQTNLHFLDDLSIVPVIVLVTIVIGRIYIGGRSSDWDEVGQRTVVRLITRLCLNTGRQTDHPSRRTI